MEGQRICVPEVLVVVAHRRWNSLERQNFPTLKGASTAMRVVATEFPAAAVGMGTSMVPSCTCQLTNIASLGAVILH